MLKENVDNDYIKVRNDITTNLPQTQDIEQKIEQKRIESPTKGIIFTFVG